MRLARVAALVASALLSTEAAQAAVTSSFTGGANTQGTLRIAGDAANDSIVVGCVGGRVVINGNAPDTGPLECTKPVTIDVKGGAGADSIDLGGIAPAQMNGVFRGVAAYASVDGGEGDDVIVGPAGGLVTIVGGPGNDWLAGRAIDRYVFDSAVFPERDTIVEPRMYECEPSYFESNRAGLSYWTVPWDSLDFRALGPSEPVLVDEPARTGMLAVHGARTIDFAGTGAGTAIEAIAGGAGPDRIAGACMAVGGAGDDVLQGTSAGDLLLGGAGDDRLLGGDGPDTLDGGRGVDQLEGEGGEDALAGGEGIDGLTGGDGGDTYLFSATTGPNDFVDERKGRGVDVLSFELQADDPVTVDLSAPTVVARARDLEVTTANPGAGRFLEGVIGGAGDDRLLGHAGRNHFWGGGGSDLAVGRAGDDTYHVDWVGSMPYGAYNWGEVWSGPFDRGSQSFRSVWQGLRTPWSLLRIAEAEHGGFDKVDAAELLLTSSVTASRLEGQLDFARVDLSSPDWIIRTEEVAVRSAGRGGARNLEGVRGTSGADVLIGNDANNFLEGRGGPDRLTGRRGIDTCVTLGDGDRLRGCERVRRTSRDR
jgi:Ca2+-binding RTX toxin-like protein